METVATIAARIRQQIESGRLQEAHAAVDSYQGASEAMCAYRRALEILQIVLGVKPSQKTELLRRQLPA